MARSVGASGLPNASVARLRSAGLLTNASLNPAIAAGATISGIGFNASYNGSNTAPAAFYVNGTLCN